MAENSTFKLIIFWFWVGEMPHGLQQLKNQELLWNYADKKPKKEKRKEKKKREEDKDKIGLDWSKKKEA
jgi:hypothetical protein